MILTFIYYYSKINKFIKFRIKAILKKLVKN